ncbi:MAG: universal stress protein [Legionellales bacterium]|nr:universal stress protein [Legionellales bacterium]
MSDYHHILCAVDLSDDSHLSLQKVSEFAKKHGAKLSLIHVIEYYPTTVYQYASSFDVEAKLTQDAENQLARLGRDFSVDSEDQYVMIGSPKFCVPNKAKQIGADLIALGRHGRHGITRLLGSTAQAIANHAECDVLIFRHADHKK